MIIAKMSQSGWLVINNDGNGIQGKKISLFSFQLTCVKGLSDIKYLSKMI